MAMLNKKISTGLTIYTYTVAL